MFPMPQAEIDAVLDDGWTAEPPASAGSDTSNLAGEVR
jgi:glycine betaine/proline transport system ATP-binding protein